MKSKNMLGKQAVVIGASMGGLLAARALSDYFEMVTILERDTLPKNGENRKGVPQGRHTHALLAKGREVLEDFFPGITSELKNKGASQTDILSTGLWYQNGGFYVQFEGGLVGSLQSRPMLETTVRERLLALPNVKVQEGCSVQGLLHEGEHVTGVRCENAEVKADLVVDASGRGSRSLAWLEQLGFSRPEEESVKINLAYASRLYEHTGTLDGNTGILINSGGTRDAVAVAQEEGRWIVTLVGMLGDHPPTDEEGFLEFARTLPQPHVYDFIRTAKPASDIVPFKYPASTRRRYEKLTRFPEGYLVFADALCSFNPVYGQGMTVAASEAKALSECLATGTNNLAKRFFKKAAVIIDTPWSIAVGADLRHPTVEGKRTPMVRFINWYINKLHRAAHHDPVVAMTFHKVANLMAAPSSLLTPATALRVLRGNLTYQTRQQVNKHSALKRATATK